MKRTIGVSLAILAASSLAGETRRPITAQDLWELQRVGAPVLSPEDK